MVMIADGGGSVRVPVNVPNPVNTAQQPASSAESDAAARARELQRQLEALLEKLREAQRQAEEARKRAIEAQRKAQEAKAHAEAMEAQAQKSRERKDADKAKKAQQDSVLEDARARKASAEANLKDKDVDLLNAQVEQKREQKKSPEAKASVETDRKVKDAQVRHDEAQRTNDLSALYADSQEKESKAQDAEAKALELTPPASKPQSVISDDERTKLSDAQKAATTLRGEADAASRKFTDALGADPQSGFQGPPSAAQTTAQPLLGAQPAPQMPTDAMHSPLLQLLQVQPRSGLDAVGGNGGYLPLSSLTLASPNLPLQGPTTLPSTPNAPAAGTGGNPAVAPLNSLFQPRPTAMTPELAKTLTSIADGRTVEQIAKDRNIGVDKVVAEANSAGIRIATTQPSEDVKVTTVWKGNASVTYTNDYHSGALTVNGSFADAKAPDGRRTVQATLDGNGLLSQTVKDEKTGRNVTQTVDVKAGTRIETAVDAEGRRTETATSLTGAPVYRTVGQYEGYLEVAKAANLTPDQLFALNPDIDYGVALKPGQQMLVSGVETTVKTYSADGSVLEKTIASDGTLQVVNTTASGRRVVLMGDAEPKSGPGEAARKAIFEDRKPIAEVAKSLNLSEQQVLDALPSGTVDVKKPTADNGEVETRTIYDPTTNRTVVEYHDWQHDSTSSKFIDEKTTFKVQGYDDQGKPAVVEIPGGAGYAQKQADDELARVGDYNKQIGDLDKLLRDARRMGDTLPEQQAQRRNLVEERDAAQDRADIAQSKATSTLTQYKQTVIDKNAAIAYQRQAVARPGSKEQADATADLSDMLGRVDKIDRLVVAAGKDVDLVEARVAKEDAHDAKLQSDQNLQTEFERWKRNWRWGGLDEKEIQKREAQGAKPVGPQYRNAEEENEAAWRDFKKGQSINDERFGTASTNGEVPWHDAWVNRNKASDAEQLANLDYDKALVASGNADAHVIAGDVARLQEKKDAWTKANPTLFSESFARQGELDTLTDQLAQKRAGALQDGQRRDYTEFLANASAPDREDPEELKKLQEKFNNDNAGAAAEVDRQVKDILLDRTRRQAKASEDYINLWATRNPALQKQLDEFGTISGTSSVRAAERRAQDKEDFLASSEQGRQLQNARSVRAKSYDALTKVSVEDDALLEKDLGDIKKSQESHTWLRDIFDDSADEAVHYTEQQRKRAKELKDQLASGEISLTKYTEEEDKLMDDYSVKAVDITREQRDNDEFWSVVDEAARIGVSTLAGIAATVATGGNIAAGVAAGVAVNELWDTTGDIVAAAQGRDIYADGHTSMWTASYKAARGDLSWDDVKFTFKDEAVDIASSAVGATGVGAGMRAGAAFSARYAVREGVQQGVAATMKLGQRASVGVRAGLVSQAVDGAGRVGVETMSVGLDGQLGSAEGDKRIQSTLVSSFMGVATAPVTGAFSAVMPLPSLAGGVLSKTKFAGAVAVQFGNDLGGSMGTGQLISLANYGRGMNEGETRAAWIQAFPGTVNNIGVHPFMARKAAAAQEQQQRLQPPEPAPQQHADDAPEARSAADEAADPANAVDASNAGNAAIASNPGAAINAANAAGAADGGGGAGGPNAGQSGQAGQNGQGGQGSDVGSGGNANAVGPADAASASSAASNGNASNVRTSDLADHAGQDMDNLVVLDADLRDLESGGDIPLRAARALSPGGMVEFRVTLDAQNAASGAGADGSGIRTAGFSGGTQGRGKAVDSGVARKGDESQAVRDSDADQDVAIRHRLRAAGFENVTINREIDVDTGRIVLVVQAHKAGPQTLDGGLPLRSRPVPRGDGTARTGDDAGEYTLPPPSSDAHTNDWATTLKAILQSGGRVKDAAFYLHGNRYDDETGMVRSPAEHGLAPAEHSPSPAVRQAAYTAGDAADDGALPPPARYETLDDALAAAQPGKGMRADDAIALVYEPLLRPDGSVPPEAVLATLGIGRNGAEAPKLATVAPNRHSDTAETRPLKVSYPPAAPRNRPSGLVLPGSVARPTHLTVPDDAAVYFTDKSGRVTQISVDDPRVAAALERAQASRARLLALPSREQGLDVDGAQAWMQAQGMKPVNLRVVDAGSVPDLPPNEAGRYLGRDGVALVARDPAAQGPQGIASVQRTIVHEAAHGNENKRGVFMLHEQTDPQTHRPVYVIEPVIGLTRFDPELGRAVGLPGEEGYAARKAQQYEESRTGPKKAGPTYDEQIDRYVQDGDNVDHGAFTAVTLDALVRMNPKLEALMERARFSSAAHDELIATMGKTLDAINGYRGTDLTTLEYQARAEAIYNAVQNNAALPPASGKAPPSPGGPVVTASRPVRRAAGAGADGLPLKPSAFGTDGDWMAAALQLEDTIAQQRAAGQGDKLPPGMIMSDADKAVTQALMKDPEPGSGECFIVSSRPPSQGIFAGGDVRAKRADVHTTLDKALGAAARQKDGAWIYRAAPEGGIAEMTRFGKARSHNILGAFHANADRTTFEVGIANPQFDRWDLSPAAPSAGRAHVYNASLTMPVGRPAEGIFRQGGIEEGADAAIAALDRAVAEGRKPSVMIAAGYSIASGRAETSGPGGAAVAGKAVRLYASQVHGEDVRVVYVAAGRSQRKVLTAALEALGERKGEHYEIVSFNARGKRAEWRSTRLLNRHEPDLLMGFDVPGRTEKGDYRNSHGQEVGYHTPARDQLFIDATRRDTTTTVAGFDLGNEVGGGHPDVHTRVQPAPDGTPIASIVTADVAMTGGRTNWVGYAFGTEVLRRGGALSAVPDETAVRGMVVKMMKAGGIDSETGSRVPFEMDSRGRKSGVGGMSPDVEAAVAAMLRVRAEKIQMAPSIDLRGVRLRLGVFDSGSGGIIAAAEIKRVVEETTGARVDLVMVGDHGAGTYGGKPKTSIADHTRAGLETLDKLGVDLIVMACNTACTSGKGEYARGIKAPVIDLIDSTRGFHKGLVQQGERVVAFSTEASAKLPLPGHDDVIGVYRDKNVLPVGGTDEGYDMASIVNRYMADPMDPAMRALMQDAADHYANKILTADPEVSTVSWCCTHYPELEPFFVQSLAKPEVRQGRGADQIKLVNPMTHQSMKAIEVAQQLPPGTGAGPSRAIGITTAVADKQKAIAGGLDPKRAEVSQAEVLDTLRIALQRDDVTLVPLERLGSDVDVEAARAMLNKDEAGDPIDALQAFDPSGRGFPIHVPGGAYAAARTLGDAGKVVVVAGFPIRTAGGRVAPESDSTKGAAVLAASLATLGKDATCITMPSNVKPLKAALEVLGRDDVDVQAFGLQAGPHAKTEALRMLRDLDPDALVSVEAPGRDAQGEYWSSTGERITADVAALDEFFYAARDINAGRGDAAPKIAQIAILDVGNEVGGGSVDKRVRRAPDGQRIASEVTADQLVTAGVGSWGADATVAALEVAHGGTRLLPTAREVPRLMQAIAREGGVDSQSRTGIDAAAGYGPTVHVGMTELYRQAALEVGADRARGADASGEPPKAGTARPAASTAAEPMSAAFRGDEWPDVHARLTSGGFGNDNVYVYRVKGQPDLYADPAAPARLTLDQIDGNGRVARGTDTVRWYGDSTPGKGLGGLMPRREMGAKFGLEPKEPKETVYRIKNRETGEITRQTDKPTDEQYGNSNLRIRTLRSRPPREASPQPVEDWFIVSNQSPARVMAANGLRDVVRGDGGFTLPSIENAPKPPGGWPLGKVIRRQITVGVVAAVGITTANAISPIDTGHDVPTGIVSLPRNPIAATSPHQHQTQAFQARPEAFSVPAEVTLGMAQHQQREADTLARQPGHDPAAAQSLQATADSRWGAFSAEMLKAIRNDVQAGANPVEAANRQRAQLLALDRLDVHSDTAVRNALRDSGLLKGTTADVQAQMDYAHLVAEHPALVNDKSRELARLDPAGFAAATLLEIGPDAPAYKSLVDDNAAMLGRLHSEAVAKDRLADGDLAGAVKEARVRLDVSRSAAERDKAAAALRPLFDAERTRALGLLDDMPMHDVGDYLAQYRDAPPEISQPVAQGMHDLMQRNLPRPSDDLASMTQFEKFVEGLSIVAESADARSPTSAWSERFATGLLEARFADRPEFTASLQRAVADAVEQGGTKLPVALANELQTRGNHDLRDNVLAGIDKGVKSQESRLTEAMGNLRGNAGYNATGASMAFYVAHFSDGTPQGAAAAIAQYRRVNPEVANKVDAATRVVGDWGLTLARTHESLNGLRVGKSASDAEKGLEDTLDGVYNKNADVTLAMAQSPQLRQDLMSRSTQGVVDPRTMTEYLVNPVMFITRHVSGTTRMVWSMVADAQFNNMVMDPNSYARRWDAFKLKTEGMAKTLGLNPDEVRQGSALVDEYVAKAAAVDANLPDAARIDAFAKLGAELDGKLQKLLGVGAKTVNNVTNANTAFGQVLRWVANAGFVTHNVSTELTNLRPLADGVQDYTQWYHRIYAPTQAFFMAKPYTTLMAERSRAGNRTIDGAAADIEGKMAWKYVFGLGTAGVGVADLSLAVGQAKTVPTWVTFTNVGMGVGGVVDGGVGLINVTGAALTRAGAVELGSLLAIPAEAATIGGLGVAVFTGIKQFYNIAHHYDQVDAREAQRDAGLRNVLKDSGFSDEQTRAMLDCTHEGVSPMVAWNALMKSQNRSIDEGMQMLRERLGKDGPQGIPTNEWVSVMHRLTDNEMNDNDGSFPASDPTAAQAGQTVVRHTPTRAGNVKSESIVLPQSIEGLENYARAHWHLDI